MPALLCLDLLFNCVFASHSGWENQLFRSAVLWPVSQKRNRKVSVMDLASARKRIYLNILGKLRDRKCPTEASGLSSRSGGHFRSPTVKTSYILHTHPTKSCYVTSQCFRWQPRQFAFRHRKLCCAPGVMSFYSLPCALILITIGITSCPLDSELYLFIAYFTLFGLCVSPRSIYFAYNYLLGWRIA